MWNRRFSVLMRCERREGQRSAPINTHRRIIPQVRRGLSATRQNLDILPGGRFGTLGKMAKNIVLFIDGTWNRPFIGEFPKNTNVLKLFKATAANPSQKRLYLPGVGTERAFWQKAAGGISGWGTKQRIQ